MTASHHAAEVIRLGGLRQQVGRIEFQAVELGAQRSTGDAFARRGHDGCEGQIEEDQ